MKKKHQYNSPFPYERILRCLALLEQNNMNISVTAREINVGRPTIYRWKKQYWQEYLAHKSKVKDQVHDVQAIKLSTVDEFDKIKEIFSETFKKAIVRAQEILDDPEKLKRLSNKDLIQLINVIAPYCAEKMGVMGAGDPENNTIAQNHTTFVQNIIEKMSISNYKKLKNDNTENKI
jgi:transposase-like protein